MFDEDLKRHCEGEAERRAPKMMAYRSAAVISASLTLAACLAGSAKAHETWVCVWGDKTDNPGFRYTLRDDTLVVDPTKDIYRVLQNNKYGIIAVASMSEFVPRLNKPVVAFFAIAIDRSTGDALEANDVSYLRGNCTKR